MVMWLDESDTVIGNGPQILIKIHPREKKQYNREIECLSRDSTGHQFRAIGYLNVIGNYYDYKLDFLCILSFV